MMFSKQYNKRALVSFRGRCPMNCKHCYTYELDKRDDRTISEIVAETGNETFDVIYISQKYENFFDEEQGLALCRELFKTYQKDILIITRSYLSDYAMNQLGILNQQMHSQGNQLYLAVSICADKSYSITEDKIMCPTPRQRLENLQRGKEYEIKTILLLRPIFPEKVIPVTECIDILKQSNDYIDAVVSSGLIVTDAILERLGLLKKSFTYLNNGNSEYLSDLENAHYLDVEKEISKIKESCLNLNIPFFRHSMPALNYLANN